MQRGPSVNALKGGNKGDEKEIKVTVHNKKLLMDVLMCGDDKPESS
jgi:hypothetical protein